MISGNKLLHSEERDALGSSEVLLLDRDERIRDGLRKLLVTSGLLVTATHDEKKALTLATQKHFAVAILDCDTPEHDKGLAVMSQLRALSPATVFILLAGRPTFDLAVRGFREGAVDVVAKTPENVKKLIEKVTSLCLEARRSDERERLLREALEVHEQFLKKLMDASRKAQQAEDAGKGPSGSWDIKECVVLVVDENPNTASGLQEALGQSSSYRCVSALNGGEALDYAGQHGFHISLVNERISDLPWSIVAKSLRKQVADGIVLLFTDPSHGPGRVAIIEGKQTLNLIPKLTKGVQLVEAIHQLREAYMAKLREKHYLQVFRQEHFDFLKRYAELRQKLTTLLSVETK